MAGIIRYLGKLKVRVNTDKSNVVRVQESSFLGFTFKGRKVTATVEAIMNFKRRVRRLTGLSRKGYWHLAKTYATNCGLSKDYLMDQGLVSLRALWIGIYYPATAR